MNEVEIIPSTNSLHGDIVVYYMPVNEIDRMYPKRKKTEEEKRRDQQLLKSARISNSMAERMGWWQG
ncbi:hypothetical protein [Salipaludibacillus sp. CF4.18]|uniref:hypothetical protein n=1 Tax=Salipaludibacillus sp. CF4.18 TaxID=3373081 RepID=UPI003EE58B77